MVVLEFNALDLECAISMVLAPAFLFQMNEYEYLLSSGLSEAMIK